MSSVAGHLFEGGTFSQVLNGFSARQQQQDMAERIAETIDKDGVLVTEAGTGVGKTFAYLVPAILSGKRVIIATGTKNLQDQLFHDDLPVVQKALKVPATTALLKGRANYLCVYRLHMNRHDGNISRQHQHEMALISNWSGRTLTGDIAEVDDVGEDSFVWPLVTSTTENCMGQGCDDYERCYVLKARQEAQAADLVVINHHLLFADMALKEQGFGDILPGGNVFIIDEAHQLPEVASNFFEQSVTSRQFFNLTSDTQTEHLRGSGLMEDLPDALNKLEKSVADLRLAMGQPGQRISWEEAQRLRNFNDYLIEVKDNLVNLRDWLEMAAERGKGLENCYKRSLSLLEHLDLMSCEPASGKTEDTDVPIENVCWVNTSRRGFGLHSTPLDIAGIFQEHVAGIQASWVFTSATLAVGESFEHFNDALGLEAPDTQLLGSPFDYEKNGLNYIPEFISNPNDPSYTREVCTQALPVIEAAEGRTFMLFTSHRALKIAAQFMTNHLSYPVLIQGEAPKQRLLKDFKAQGNAVLLGTSSFWEGVDVRGSALSCVIIDKLPFTSPSDPVVRARLDAMRKRGQNPFFDYQVPGAVVALKQGAGRLIRDVNDVGVLMLCDPRLLGKSYGRIFLHSLPEMPLSCELVDVQRFFQSQKCA